MKPAFSPDARHPSHPAMEPLRWIRRHLESRRPELTFQARTPAGWRAWRRALRPRLAAVIGLPEHTPDPGPPRATLCRVDRCEGYDRHALLIETLPDMPVPAFLLVPHGPARPRPALLCCHGHGNGMNALVALTDDGRPRRLGAGYQRDFAVQAVRAGFVALTWDQMGFGRRRDVAFNRRQGIANACEQPSKNLLHAGLSMTGLRVWDAMRMIDFLQSRPQARPGALGMVGISGGGLVTQFTAALDDRIAAACVSGYCNRFSASILSIRHCLDNFVPGLGPLADNDDIACLIAPRPLLIESGTRDPIFPIAATRAAVAKLRRCYRLAGRPQALETFLFPGPHRFDGRKTWPFFRRWLGESG